MSYTAKGPGAGDRGAARPRAASERTLRKRIEARRTHVLHALGRDGVVRSAPLNIALAASSAAGRGEVIRVAKRPRSKEQKP